MKTRTFFILLSSLSILWSPPQDALACIWDADTIITERQRFPSTLELITGKFLRHSEAFYAWRIQDRKRRIKQEPKNLALYDDLAVAFEKTGQTQKAIALMLQKLKTKPKLYTTYANLGTFYIHAGQLEKGLVYIKKAIEINPNAHFGREIIQRYLVEYVLERKSAKEATKEILLPLQSLSSNKRLRNFYTFVQQKKMTDRKKVLKGILGMMRFGNFRSPILLEALGDSLITDLDMDADASLLAARAYLSASENAKVPSSKQKYLQLAKRMFLRHNNTDFDSLARLFAKEQEHAVLWYAELIKNETRWIKEGNPEAAFARTYHSIPALPLYEHELLKVKVKKLYDSAASRGMGMVFFGFFVLLVLGGTSIWWYQRKQSLFFAQGD